MAKKAAASAPAFTADQLALIAEREQILLWLTPAKEREMEIRTALASALFPSPSEGTNRLVTADGYEVILDHKINRTIDEAALDAVMLELPEDCPARIPGVLIKYKPSLVAAGYKALPADQLKIVQQAITEKPGAPELGIAKAAQPDPQDIAEMQADPQSLAGDQTVEGPNTVIIEGTRKLPKKKKAAPAKAKKKK